MRPQEYLNRQDEYALVFFFANPGLDPDANAWHAVQININGWTYHLQAEG